MNWSDHPPNWNTPIGEKIDRFFQAVAERYPGYGETIVVLGSARPRFIFGSILTSTAPMPTCG